MILVVVALCLAGVALGVVVMAALAARRPPPNRK